MNKMNRAINRNEKRRSKRFRQEQSLSKTNCLTKEINKFIALVLAERIIKKLELEKNNACKSL